MGDLGTIGERVNANKMQIYVGTTSNQWKLLQNASVSIAQPIIREPTTDGGVLLFTGAPDNSISGSLIFTRDEWNDATNGFKIKLLRSSSTGEVPATDWLVKFTDVSGVATNGTLTFDDSKLAIVNIVKGVEGAVKADISIVCPSFPTTS